MYIIIIKKSVIVDTLKLQLLSLQFKFSINTTPVKALELYSNNYLFEIFYPTNKSQGNTHTHT